MMQEGMCEVLQRRANEVLWGLDEVQGAMREDAVQAAKSITGTKLPRMAAPQLLADMLFLPGALSLLTP